MRAGITPCSHFNLTHFINTIFFEAWYWSASNLTNVHDGSPAANRLEVFAETTVSGSENFTLYISEIIEQQQPSSSPQSCRIAAAPNKPPPPTWS
jgi:hypothetical protein